MSVLASTVIVTDEVTGQPIVLMAGSTPDKKYADMIDNPKAWDADYEPEQGSEPIVFNADGTTTGEPAAAKAPAKRAPAKAPAKRAPAKKVAAKKAVAK